MPQLSYRSTLQGPAGFVRHSGCLAIRVVPVKNRQRLANITWVLMYISDGLV